MTPQFVGLVGLLLLLLMLLARMPVAIAMGLVGFVGYGILNGFQNAVQITGLVPFEVATNYSLSQLPLFILMGELAVRSGMSGRLFDAASRIFSGIRGSLAMATIGACAGFGAISGSSIATTATMTRIVMPAMRVARYNDLLSAGSIAAGGTLGILIPPSITLVIYALIAEQSVPRLYAASLIPGLLLVLLYLGVVFIMVRLRPEWTGEQEGKRLSLRDRMAALIQVWEIALLFVLVIGGIYAGILTATAAAAVGVFGAWLLGAATRRLSVRETLEGIAETTKVTAMLFIILVSANIFTYFVVFTQLPQMALGLVEAIDIGPFAVMLFLMVFYLVLGCFLEAFGILLITVPIFLPLVQAAGYSPIWFGIFLVVVIEAGMITPPLGMNIFVMQAQLPGMRLATLYRSIAPYLVALVVMMLFLISMPELATWLPTRLFPKP